MGCFLLPPSTPTPITQSCPTGPPEGSKCMKHKVLGNLVLQQVAGEGRR